MDYALTNISGNGPLIPNPAWDLVAAINLSEPSFCQSTPLRIEVNTDGKPEVNQGQTLAIPNQPPNTNVCLNPSLANLPFSSQELFSNKAKPHSVPEANSGLGLLAAAASAVLLRKHSNRQTAKKLRKGFHLGIIS